MSVDTETRNAAADQIHHTLIDMLHGWVQNEKANLDGYIENPTLHAEYNPYLIINSEALLQRSGYLSVFAEYLYNASQYKQGNPDVTQSMRDMAFDDVPSIVWARLYDYVLKVEKQMQEVIDNASNPNVPISDYAGFATFNVERFMSELNIYRDGVTNLPVVIQFLQERGK